MAKKPPAADPAAPQLPQQLTSWDSVASPLEDDAQWWQLEIVGDVGAVEAARFDAEQCRIARADMSAGVWAKAGVVNCVFEDVNLANVFAQDCRMRRTSVTSVRGTGLQWTNGVVKDVVFRDCRLDLAGFRFSRFSHVVFDNCRLSGADFTAADLSGVRFESCDLSSAKFDEATMTGAVLRHCTLAGMRGVDGLRGASVTSTDLMSLTFTLADACGITVTQDQAGASRMPELGGFPDDRAPVLLASWRGNRAFQAPVVGEGGASWRSWSGRKMAA
ncbi:MAG TPA: pentapeptide repeat-containing protein [Candidatus Stackebrandtia faecavium]|nr:pentapeptide repeat-containing protein [Candidatus Stackebrandtia faecavium]